MKKVLALFMTVMTVFTQLHVFAFESEANLIKSTGEYLIRFNLEKDSQQSLFTNAILDSKENIENVLKANLSDDASVIVKDEITETRFGKKTQLVSVTGKNDAAVIAQLREIDGVEYVEPNYKIEAFYDPDFGQQWALTDSSLYHINIDAAWKITKGNTDTIVAVLDSGIDINHPDLVDNIYTSPTETENGEDTDGNGFKDDVHGWDFTTYVNPTQTEPIPFRQI